MNIAFGIAFFSLAIYVALDLQYNAFMNGEYMRKNRRRWKYFALSGLSFMFGLAILFLYPQ